jgi:SAM-dependent methyltransferase
MTCIVCGCELISYIKKPKDYEYNKSLLIQNEIMLCISCKCIQQYQMPSKEELDNLYDIKYQNYTHSNLLLSKLWLMWQKLLCINFSHKYSKDITVLDFGSGNGQFLKILYQYGFKNLFGFDVLKSTLENKNYKIINSYNDLKKISYGLIRLNHVIEHFNDPVESMIRIKDLLSKNGLVVGQTPNTDSITFNMFKCYWGCLHYPYHTVIYDRNSLELLANKCGYTLVSISYSLMPTGWSMSFENFLKKRLNIKKTGRLKIYPVLILIGAFLSLVEFVFTKKTSVMNFVLFKK